MYDRTNARRALAELFGKRIVTDPRTGKQFVHVYDHTTGGVQHVTLDAIVDAATLDFMFGNAR